MGRLGCLGLLLVALAAAISGCGSFWSSKDHRQMIQSADPVQRARGCKLAGDRKDSASVPLLVDRLEDRDRGVRLFAVQALRMITGKDFGYRESDPPPLRAEAVARWRQYAASRGSGKR